MGNLRTVGLLLLATTLSMAVAPAAFADNAPVGGGVVTSWSGSQYYVDPGSCGYEEVTWSISYSPASNEYSWSWSTYVYWLPSYIYCYNDNASSGCPFLIGASDETVSSPNSGSGTCSSPPDFTVGPTATASFEGLCIFFPFFSVGNIVTLGPDWTTIST